MIYKKKTSLNLTSRGKHTKTVPLEYEKWKTLTPLGGAGRAVSAAPSAWEQNEAKPLRDDPVSSPSLVICRTGQEEALSSTRPDSQY